MSQPQTLCESASDPPPLRRSLLEQREPGGFWIPNTLLDLHGATLGARGVYLYCLICITTLARKSRIARSYVVKMIKYLHDVGELNDRDLQAINHAGQRDSSAPLVLEENTDEDDY